MSHRTARPHGRTSHVKQLSAADFAHAGGIAVGAELDAQEQAAKSETCRGPAFASSFRLAAEGEKSMWMCATVAQPFEGIGAWDEDDEDDDFFDDDDDDEDEDEDEDLDDDEDFEFDEEEDDDDDEDEDDEDLFDEEDDDVDDEDEEAKGEEDAVDAMEEGDEGDEEMFGGELLVGDEQGF